MSRATPTIQISEKASKVAEKADEEYRAENAIEFASVYDSIED